MEVLKSLSAKNAIWVRQGRDGGVGGDSGLAAEVGVAPGGWPQVIEGIVKRRNWICDHLSLFSLPNPQCLLAQLSASQEYGPATFGLNYRGLGPRFSSSQSRPLLPFPYPMLTRHWIKFSLLSLHLCPSQWIHWSFKAKVWPEHTFQ